MYNSNILLAEIYEGLLLFCSFYFFGKSKSHPYIQIYQEIYNFIIMRLLRIRNKKTLQRNSIIIHVL